MSWTNAEWDCLENSHRSFLSNHRTPSQWRNSSDMYRCHENLSDRSTFHADHSSRSNLRRYHRSVSLCKLVLLFTLLPRPSLSVQMAANDVGLTVLGGSENNLITVFRDEFRRAHSWLNSLVVVVVVVWLGLIIKYRSSVVGLSMITSTGCTRQPFDWQSVFLTSAERNDNQSSRQETEQYKARQKSPTVRLHLDLQTWTMAFIQTSQRTHSPLC